MRPAWKGSINFGLVNIPVALYPATKREELKFRLLRASDLSPINYKRVAEVDGKEVPWGQIVKGYEYEKGKFVVLKEEDFKRVDIEATQTITIIDFVELKQINPMFFYRPYYLEPQKGAATAYALLRTVLAEEGKVGMAKVVIREREHLAALKANSDALVLELMHFAHELTPGGKFSPPHKEKLAAPQLKMARALVEQMTENWDPRRYKDDYTSALMNLIGQKIKKGGKALPTASAPKRKATNVIDLMSVLEKSLRQSGGGAGHRPLRAAKRAKAARAA